MNNKTMAVNTTKENRRFMLGMIRAGDRVTILLPAGIGRNGVEYVEKTGRAVIGGPDRWVLNMGGRYGRPAVATIENLVSFRRTK